MDLAEAQTVRVCLLVRENKGGWGAENIVLSRCICSISSETHSGENDVLGGFIMFL